MLNISMNDFSEWVLLGVFVVGVAFIILSALGGIGIMLFRALTKKVK